VAPATSAAPPPDTESDRKAPDANPVFQTIGSIVSAVLLTTVVAALGASPTANLVTAVLGVAIPQFITYVGPRRHIRLGVAIVVTIIALVLTYGGVKVFDAAADKETFPDPISTPTPTPAPPTPTASPPVHRGPHIRVTPERLSCTATGCDDQVTIESTGTGELRTGDIAFEGGDDLFSRTDECVGKPIPADTPCRFTVTFAPTTDQGTVKATLVIHQNLRGPASRVPVEGSGGPVMATGNAAFDGDPTCARGDDGTLAVAVTATADTPGQLPVSVLLTGDGSTLASDTLTAGEPGSVPIPDSASGATVTVRLGTIDGDDASDNEAEVTCVA
jgi:hypothetical protein